MEGSQSIMSDNKSFFVFCCIGLYSFSDRDGGSLAHHTYILINWFRQDVFIEQLLDVEPGRGPFIPSVNPQNSCSMIKAKIFLTLKRPRTSDKSPFTKSKRGHRRCLLRNLFACCRNLDVAMLHAHQGFPMTTQVKTGLRIKEKRESIAKGLEKSSTRLATSTSWFNKFAKDVAVFKKKNRNMQFRERKSFQENQQSYHPRASLFYCRWIDEIQELAWRRYILPIFFPCCQ